MKQTRWLERSRIPTILLMIGFAVNAQTVNSQGTPNRLTFDNQSEEDAVVKLVGPTSQTVDVPRGQDRTVNIAAGEYYLLVRYGNLTSKYHYTKGEPFTVRHTATQYSQMKLTLNKVIDGNYMSRPSSRGEFEQTAIENRSRNVVVPNTALEARDTEMQLASPNRPQRDATSIAGPVDGTTWQGFTDNRLRVSLRFLLGGALEYEFEEEPGCIYKRMDGTWEQKGNDINIKIRCPGGPLCTQPCPDQTAPCWKVESAPTLPGGKCRVPYRRLGEEIDATLEGRFLRGTSFVITNVVYGSCPPSEPLPDWMKKQGGILLCEKEKERSLHAKWTLEEMVKQAPESKNISRKREPRWDEQTERRTGNSTGNLIGRKKSLVLLVEGPYTHVSKHLEK